MPPSQGIGSDVISLRLISRPVLFDAAVRIRLLRSFGAVTAGSCCRCGDYIVVQVNIIGSSKIVLQYNGNIANTNHGIFASKICDKTISRCQFSYVTRVQFNLLAQNLDQYRRRTSRGRSPPFCTPSDVVSCIGVKLGAHWGFNGLVTFEMSQGKFEKVAAPLRNFHFYFYSLKICMRVNISNCLRIKTTIKLISQNVKSTLFCLLSPHLINYKRL